MAGMDWFRWHHGSVTDPKFLLVARQSSASLPDVLAVWTYMLETASLSADRGCFGELDSEAIDLLFDFPEGKTAQILGAMTKRGLIGNDRITSWEKRQPKREREDDKSTDRVRTFRDKQRHETPNETMERQETPRGEESREEEINKEPTVLVGLASNPPGTVKPFRIPCPAEKLLDAFHEACPTLPRVMKLNDKRKTHLTARWREVDSDSKFSSADDGVSVFRAIFAKVHASDFLAGRAKDWKASFDWLTESSTNFLKVCEGHYDNDKRAAR